MNRGSHSDDALYRDCITWNVPAVRRSNNPDAISFIETLQLRPQRFSADESEHDWLTASPLGRAASGLRAEISGDGETARQLYDSVAELPGIQGVLGQLLIAWMADATPDDFRRVEERLGELTGPGINDIRARVHCRLAGWALDHGWQELSRHHFSLAQKVAGKELGHRLGEIGHWFGLGQRIYLHAKSGPMIRLPWIVDYMDDAARKSVEDRFKESFKSPWTRTWTVGAYSIEGTDIQAAEMQASWAGALWLMPTIQRQHAAHILNKSSDPTDISRAIALWVRGRGKNADQLVNAYEGHLTGEAVSDLLIDKLHAGRSVPNFSSWLETCHALWSEMPESLVEDIVGSYRGPSHELRLHSDDAELLSLISKLLSRLQSVTPAVSSFDDEQLALLLRVAPRDLLEKLDVYSLRRGLKSALAYEGQEWATTGWSALAEAWTLLPSRDRDELRELFAEKVPRWQIARAAAVAGDLFSAEFLASQLGSEITSVRGDIADAGRGMFSGRSIEPAASIAWLTYRIGSVSDDAESALVDLATDRRVDGSQRQAALSAMTMLAREGLLTKANVAAAFQPVEPALSIRMMDDSAADQRYEDLQRVALKLSFGYESSEDGVLLAGSRDPSTRVRHLAVETVQWLSSQGAESPAIDGALLGALYDPHPVVQAAAIPALWRGSFASSVLQETARRRVVDLWPTAPLELRYAIAREVRESARSDDETLRALAEGCSADRSLLVRRALAESDQ